MSEQSTSSSVLGAQTADFVHALAEQHSNPLAVGLDHSPITPTTFVIFGGTGDLAHRKLLPAIYNLAHEGSLPGRFNLVGFAFEEYDTESYRAMVRSSIEEFSRTRPNPQVLDAGLLSLRVATISAASLFPGALMTRPLTRS